MQEATSQLASTWVALSQLPPRWQQHVAGRTGSRQIRCGAAQHGKACAKGCDWSGTRDPSDPLRPPRRVGRHVQKNPLGFKGDRQVLGTKPQRSGDSGWSRWR
jgi:hypothetical protein